MSLLINIQKHRLKCLPNQGILTNHGTNITMPSMTGWSRKEAEAFGAMANVEIGIQRCRFDL